MQDNFNEDIFETLVKYADNELNTGEQQAVEKLLQQDAELNERYQNLVTARQAVRSLGIKERVQKIHNEYTQQQATPLNKPTAKVVKANTFFTTFMRVAAVLFIAVAGYAVFLFGSTSSQSEFNNNFIEYHATTTRGSDDINNLNTLYNNRNYTAAIQSFNTIKNKTQHDYFLAAQAYLQLGQTADAINAFKSVEALNNSSYAKYFEQETDYYLMMAYIKSGQIKLAEQKLDLITSNRQHLFYNKAKSISRIKLGILKWKN